MVIALLKLYFILVIVVLIIYAIRHFVFSVSRLYGKQKISYRDIYDCELPLMTVLIPMHNEELVLKNVIESLLKCDYDQDKLEIIAVNDHSEDRTEEMLEQYFGAYPFVKCIHRKSEEGERGKPAALNEAMEKAMGEIIVVFDADYRPSRNLLRKLATAFQDPQTGAVMGRVIPLNANVNILTRLLNLERSGGYQVDQQARYNLNTVPQYGGTVGGFRKDLLIESGGFNTKILAEDTELTFRLYAQGWQIVYDNSAECYEEVPETWQVRGKQVRRWSRGHNEVLFRYLGQVILAPHLKLWKKLDGILLLFVYAVPLLLLLGLADCLLLFFLGEMNIFEGWWIILFVGAYNSWGNFAPFYEIAAGALLDGMEDEILTLPMLSFSFYFYMWHISCGFVDAVVDTVTQRTVKWAKTVRSGKQAPETGKQAPEIGKEGEG